MKTLTRVERHVIKPTDKRYAQIASICYKSKNLYNYANYILRQAFIMDKKLPKEYDLTTLLAKENQVDYRSLPAQTSQQVIKLLYKNYKSFFKAIKSYRKDKSKFTSNPKLPKYKKKDGYSITIFTNQQVKLKDCYIMFPKSVNIKPIKTKASSIEQARIIPKATCFIVEVVFQRAITSYEKIDGSVASIDLGVSNFVTFLDNQGNVPFIINGKEAKAYNQYYHKRLARAQSLLKKDKYVSNEIRRLTFRRDMFMRNFLHQSSSKIIKALKDRKISTLVIGLNADWKQGVGNGKRNNQAFVSLPHKSFIEQTVYKCEEIGVEVMLTEESYTSKIDHFAQEPMEKRQKYLGKRIYRGLFKSSTGKTVNADVNGALGIMRKVFPEKVLKLIGDRGVAFTPVIVNPVNRLKANVDALNDRIGFYATKEFVNAS